jgi:RNA polymerase sigma-70 factor, ECF subfamily
VKTDEDMESFDGLYEMYRMPIYRFACALAGDAGDAEDLFQEVWLRAATAFRKGAGAREDAGDARSWLFAIAANAHRDNLRKRRIRGLFFRERARSMAEAAADGDRGWDVPRAEAGAGESRSDIRGCLRRAVARLPGKERRVFVLKDIEGFKHAEIGRMLGIPEATVRTLRHKAVKRLQRELAEFRPAARTAAAAEGGRP